VDPGTSGGYRPRVLVPTLVVLLCGAVILVSGAAVLRDRVRARRAPALVPGSAPHPGETELADEGRWPILAWFGLAAVTVLGAGAFAHRRPHIDDLMFVVLLLGYAGHRAFYLLRRRSGVGPALGAEVLSLIVGALGVLVGFTI
jgi:hypothetical protein